MTDQPIRRWEPSTDLAWLVVVSQASDVMFADFGLPLPPDDPTDELRRAEHVLVAGTPPVGFAVLNTVDGRAHLASLGVHPAYGRQGIGGRLLAAACALAAAEGRSAVTLTTFVDVPWNAPWYAARGFVELTPDRWDTGLRAVWTAEVADGIAVAPRTAMIRSCTGQTEPGTINDRGRQVPRTE